MMKILALILFSAAAIPQAAVAQAGDRGVKNASAHNVSVSSNVADMAPAAECSLPAEVLPRPSARSTYSGRAGETLSTDTLSLPLLNVHGNMPLMGCPNDYFWGMETWQLHRGLNVNLSASVFASFGKRAPKGAGFGQDLSVMYAVPLTNRLSLGVGGWISNAYWGHGRFTDAGVSAVLGYKFDDHWEAYVYGRKSIVNKPMPYRFATMGELGDRIGAAVKYNFSPSFSMQVSVSAGRSEWQRANGDDFSRLADGMPR